MVGTGGSTAEVARHALGQTLLFGGLRDALIDHLASQCQEHRYARGQMVFSEGDVGGDILIVADGRLKVLARSQEGVEVVLFIALPGDTLGEVSLFDEGSRSANIEAAESSVVVRVPGDAVRELLHADPHFAEEIIRQQASLIRRTTGMIADLVFLDLPRRVAKYVVERTGSDGCADLGVSQGELAAAIGGVRQSVNSALRGFERRGWVELHGRSITVRDRDALTRYAQLESV